MKAKRLGWPLAAWVFLGAWTSAQALTSNPPILMTRGIEYMCGGRGSAEAEFMRMVSPRWAAALEFSVSRAKPEQMLDEVTVVVRERYTGRPVMDVVAEAPFLLARLDPGAYEIDATLGGVTLRQPLTVFNGVASRAVFVWPSNVDFANAGRLGLVQRQASARSSD